MARGYHRGMPAMSRASASAPARPFPPVPRDAGIPFLYGNDSVPHEPATIEGGDITVACEELG